MTVPSPRDGRPVEGAEGSKPWIRALGAGTELAAVFAAGLLGGHWLDGRLGTGPWMTVLGALAGMTLGFYQLIRLVTDTARRR